MGRITKRFMTQMPGGIWALGFVSMLADIASETIHSLLPVFLVSILGANAFTVGLLEGIAESTALIVRVFSGVLSDYLGKRKALAVIGYALGACCKPLFAMANSVGVVFFARFLDRIGKGIRGAPRDALIADIAPPSKLGAAYGLRQSMDTVGAFLGPIAAIGLMICFADNFRMVFWFAVIPGILSVVVLLVFVQDPQKMRDVNRENPINWTELKKLGITYWWVISISGVFTLARFSEAFLLLSAQQFGLAPKWIPLIFIAMNIVYSLSAYPFGKLSDRTGPAKLLMIGLCLLIVADLILAFGNALAFVFLGSCLWGLHLGATQGVLAAMIARVAPEHLRGTAFGFFYLISGLAMLIASLLAGVIWEQLGASYTYLTGILFCVLALGGILCGNISFNTE